MGSIIQPYCNHCEKDFKEIFVGGGMTNFETICNVPSSCSNCGNVFSRNLFSEKLKCPKCRRKVEYFGEIHSRNYDLTNVFEWKIGDIMDDKEYQLKDKKYKCPNCGETELVFHNCGNWD